MGRITQISTAWYISKALASTLGKKPANVCTPMTVFGRLSFRRQPFGLYSLSQDFHQTIQQNWDGSKAVTPKWSSSMGKPYWDKKWQGKAKQTKPLFCAVDIIKFGNLLSMARCSGRSQTENLPSPHISNGKDSSGSVWTAEPCCPAKHVHSQHLRALQGNIQQNKIHTLMKCFSNQNSWLLLHKPETSGPQICTQVICRDCW